MDIFGIGTDIVECVRILKLIERHGELFLRRLFTDREINYCQGKKRSTQHFAGRWAAKEAIFKSLGMAWSKGLPWTDLEIRHDAQGKPEVRVGGAAKDLMKQMRIADILVSISQCRSYATAYALALRRPPKKKESESPPPKNDEDTQIQ